jgi:hypothetical protein
MLGILGILAESRLPENPPRMVALMSDQPLKSPTAALTCRLRRRRPELPALLFAFLFGRY